nr:unnamed protein product [Callosobruchus analis]
MHRMPC